MKSKKLDDFFGFDSSLVEQKHRLLTDDEEIEDAEYSDDDSDDAESTALATTDPDKSGDDIYDARDLKGFSDTDAIKKRALRLFKMLEDKLQDDDTDPKYLSRMAEVANQVLSTALHAENQKSKHKLAKENLVKKAKPASSGGRGNTTIIATTAQIIEMMHNQDNPPMKTINDKD